MATWTSYTGGLPRWAAEQLDALHAPPATQSRRAAAWRVLAAHDAPDLAEALGLAGPCHAGPVQTTTERGYGWPHQQLRRAVQADVDAGAAQCWRCGRPILPGQPWDLGHDDHDRAVYRGPEHVACNRATATRRPGQPEPCWCGGGCLVHVPVDEI